MIDNYIFDFGNVLAEFYPALKDKESKEKFLWKDI